ncbi:MAG TPA: hypothetical protein PKD41_02210 [Solidesulfovibrio sp.]|nr:hypothetical protein [Desulfovibrio sp.]HML59671.1 hypothetical protein [Solidesulfovibrio sp.]
MTKCFECGSDFASESTVSLEFKDDHSDLAYSIQASSGSICRRCFAEALIASLSVTVLVKADEEESVAA